MTTTLELRLATPADRQQVANALSAAFYEDPVFRWIYPDDGRRREVLPAFFAIIGEAIVQLGVSHVAGDGIGAALWFPPDAGPADEEAQAAEEALVESLVALSPGDGGRLTTCMAMMQEAHPHEPSWYLNLLGVVPDHQGTGVGGTLLRAALDRSDDDGAPSYLEATSADNRRLYERHGFEVIGEIQLPDGPPMWPMWRTPQPR